MQVLKFVVLPIVALVLIVLARPLILGGLFATGICYCCSSSFRNWIETQ